LESLLGEVIREVLRTFGVLPMLGRIVVDGVDVLHPVSRLAHWAAKSKPQKMHKYRLEIADRRIMYTIGIRDKTGEKQL